MKIKILVIALFFNLVGCMTTASVNSVYVIFKSSGEMVDLLGVSGLDMGPMYSPESYTPKNVGDEGYTSYNEVKLDEYLVIQWRTSKNDHAKILKQVVKRPLNVPRIIPRNYSVIFNYENGNWTISMIQGYI